MCKSKETEDEIITGNYFCVNCTCDKQSKDFAIQTLESEKRSQKCPNDEAVTLKYMGQKLSGGYMRIGSDKVRLNEALKKRATAHYNKNIKNKKDDLTDRAMSEFRNLGALKK